MGLTGNQLVEHDQVNAVNVKLQALIAAYEAAIPQLTAAGATSTLPLVQALKVAVDPFKDQLAAAGGMAVDLGNASS